MKPKKERVKNRCMSNGPPLMKIYGLFSKQKKHGLASIYASSGEKTMNQSKQFFSTHLGKKITKSPSNKRSARLGSQRVLVKSVIVLGPSGNSSSSDDGWVAEERTGRGSVLAESGLLESRLAGRRSWGDTEGADSEPRGCYKNVSKLHFEDRLKYVSLKT